MAGMSRGIGTAQFIEESVPGLAASVQENLFGRVNAVGELGLAQEGPAGLHRVEVRAAAR